jgi:NAD(P)-dependent dehydrogenase (short-subunit alcohol dehydrogenase family)
MAVQLKKLPDQVIVITGASSGIGLVTARMAAEQGARSVLASSRPEIHKLSFDNISESTKMRPL